MTDGLPYHIKQLNLNILTQTHFTKKTTKGMYGYYNKIPSFSEYEDTHFDDCLDLMKRLPIYEKLGIDLNQLLEMDDEKIIKIKDKLTVAVGETANGMEELERKNRGKKVNQRKTRKG